MSICSNCFTKHADNQNFCESCGAKLTEDDNRQVWFKRNKEDKKKLTSLEKEKTCKNDEEKIMEEQCPNCNKERKKNEKYCQFCNFLFDVNTTAVDKRNRLNKKFFLVVPLLVIIFIGLYKGMENYYSEENQIKRYQEVLLSASSDKLTKILVSSDGNFQMNSKNIKPYTDYLKENKAYLADLVEHLKQTNDNSDDVYLRKSGKYFFVFDRFDLVIKPIYFNVKTNIEGMTLSVNDREEISVSDSEDFSWKIGPLAPGEYVIKGTFEKHGKENILEKKFEQINRVEIYEQNTRQVFFDVRKIKFNLVTNKIEGELLANDIPVATLDESGITPIEIFWQEDTVLKIKQKKANLEIVSKPLKFDADNYLLENYSKNQSQLKVPNTTLSIYTNEPKGNLYLNGKKITTLDNGVVEKLILVDSDEALQFQAKQEFQDGSRIETPAIKYDGSSIVQLAFEKVINESKMDDFLSNFYYDVANFMSEPEEFETHLTTYFENGKESNAYKAFKEDLIQLSKQEGAPLMIYSTKVESIERTSPDNYKVIYNICHYNGYTIRDGGPYKYFQYNNTNFTLGDKENIMIRDLGGADNLVKISESVALSGTSY